TLRCTWAVSAVLSFLFFFFFSSRRRHTRSKRDWSSDVCSSDLVLLRYVVGCWTCCFLLSSEVSVALLLVFGELGQLLVDELGERSEERRVGKECGWRGGRGACSGRRGV